MPDSTVTLRILADGTQADKAFRQTGASAEANLGKSGKVGMASLESGEAAAEASGKFSGLKGMLKSGLEIAGPIAAVAIGKKLFDTFNEDQKATALLNTAMKNAGEKTTPAFTKAMDDLVAKGESYGQSSGATTTAVASLTAAGLNQSQVMQAMPAIYDLAAAKGITLADATKAVVMGLQGNGRALKDLNVMLPAVLPTQAALTAAQAAQAKASAAAAAAQANLTAVSEKYGDKSKQAVAAQKAYETALAKSQAATAKLATVQHAATDRTANLTAVTGILEGKLGGSATAQAHTFAGSIDALKTKLLDTGAKMLSNLMPAIQQIMAVLMQAITAAMPAIAQVGKSLSAVFLALAPALKTILPILGAVLTIGLTVLGGIMTAIAKVITFVVTNFVPIGKALAAPFVEAWAIISGIWNGVTGFFGKIISNVSGIFRGIGAALAAPFHAAVHVIVGIINGFLGAVQNVINAIPTFGAGHPTIPRLPSFHTGGIVPGPAGSETFARLLAGEAVLSPQVTRQVMQGGGIGSAPGGRQVTVNLQAITTSDPNAISRAVVGGLRTRALAA